MFEAKRSAAFFAASVTLIKVSLTLVFAMILRIEEVALEDGEPLRGALGDFGLESMSLLFVFEEERILFPSPSSNSDLRRFSDSFEADRGAEIAMPKINRWGAIWLFFW